MNPPMSDAVAAAYAGFPAPARAGCLALRDLVFEVAGQTPEAGRIAEELRWGQPAYLTPETKAGTTIRIGVPKGGGYALFVHCQTTLIEGFRAVAPPEARFDGTRGVLFSDTAAVDKPAMALLIRAALTYHLRKSVERAV